MLEGLLFPSSSLPQHALPCPPGFRPPFLRNSQVNFINVGVEQMLKATQDFVFCF